MITSQDRHLTFDTIETGFLGHRCGMSEFLDDSPWVLERGRLREWMFDDDASLRRNGTNHDITGFIRELPELSTSGSNGRRSNDGLSGLLLRLHVRMSKPSCMHKLDIFQYNPSTENKAKILTWQKMRPPALCTLSVTFFHPLTCSSFQMPGAPGHSVPC